MKIEDIFKRTEKVRLKFEKATNFLSGVLAVMVILGIYTDSYHISIKNVLFEKSINEKYEDLKLLNVKNQRRIRILENELSASKKTIVKRDSSVFISVTAKELSELEDSVRLLNERFRKVEKIIIQDPTKSLEIPFIKRDIDDTNKQTKVALDNMQNDINDLKSFLLGSLVTLAIAILGQVITNIFSKK